MNGGQGSDERERWARVVAGCRVVATTDVTEALRAAEERAFDLLILDLNMPEMSGWDALERFREIDPELPVLIATGVGSGAEARERGAQGLLPKPFTPGQLVEAAAALASGAPRREGRV